MSGRLNRLLWNYWDRVAHFAGRSYTIGPALEDAFRVCQQLARASFPSTIGYFDTASDSLEYMLDLHVKALDRLRLESWDCYVSLKAPAWKFSAEALSPVAQRAQDNGIRLHFDALAPSQADPTQALIDHLLPIHSSLGCTLPGRWRRSIKDAEWAIERKLRIRVVKGQWADSTTPEQDWKEGYLAVIDRLAGRAHHVMVATHDPILAREALKRLLRNKTSCSLELLFGLPLKRPLQVSRETGVPVRLYLPFGHGWVPYCISQVYHNPRIPWWIFRDVVTGRYSRLPRLARNCSESIPLPQGGEELLLRKFQK